ncbi:hypothetical protein [Fructilactobacillus florum]|uniref:hypothetical protein n=1 Tax=Fructilactobacillus florum TaxID=640331 RepID=UPI00209229F9|nr:hypothetical protein [Fructilactobacillus florum]
MLRKTMKSNPDTEISTWWNVLMTILAGVVFWGYFRWQRVTTISLTGTNSIASLTITLGLLMGMLLFTICLIKTRKTAQHLVYHNVYWRNFPTLIISCAAVLLICLLGLFLGFNAGFLRSFIWDFYRHVDFFTVSIGH